MSKRLYFIRPILEYVDVVWKVGIYVWRVSKRQLPGLRINQIVTKRLYVRRSPIQPTGVDIDRRAVKCSQRFIVNPSGPGA